MLAKSLLLLFLAVFNCVLTRDIPDYIHKCKRSDPQVSKCITESVYALRPHLKAGIPELDVPPLEPLTIDEIAIIRNSDATNFKAYLRDVKVHEASTFQITKLKVDIPKAIYRVGVKFPILRLVGRYDIDARLLVVPIKGQGTFTVNATECDGQAVLRGKISEVDGHKEMSFQSFNFKIKIGGFNIKLDNLFNGDPVLGQAVNDALNQDEFINTALPFIEQRTSDFLLKAANKITKGLDYEQLFPEN